MRELTIVGLDVDGKHVICESTRDNGDPGDKFKIRVDDRLRAAARGDGVRVGLGVLHQPDAARGGGALPARPASMTAARLGFP